MAEDGAGVGARRSNATISGQLHSRKRARNANTLLESLKPDLDDFASVLSLLSRRHVRWSEPVIDFETPGGLSLLSDVL